MAYLRNPIDYNTRTLERTSIRAQHAECLAIAAQTRDMPEVALSLIHSAAHLRQKYL